MPPTKRTEMKKSLYSLFAVLAIFCACQDENSQLGKSLVESSFYNVYADTCSVDISTILLDSIETRGDSICQLGHYRSSAWGEVSATYYAEYSTSDFTPNTDYTYTLDSLVLRMIPSGHFWGDTLTQQRISIYRLKTLSCWTTTRTFTTAPYSRRKMPHSSALPSPPARGGRRK